MISKTNISAVVVLFTTLTSVFAANDDLTAFGNRVYDLMTSANIFDKIFSLSSDAREVERSFYAGNLEFIIYLRIPAYGEVQRTADAAIDNFNGKGTAYKNFKAEMHSAEYYLNKKGLLAPGNTDYYATLYFQSQKKALDYVENSGQSIVPYVMLNWGDINFYSALGVGAEDGKDLMIFFADEMEKIRRS